MVTNNAVNEPTGASGTVLQGQGVGTASSFSTATFPSTATSTGTVLRADGTNWSATTATYPTTTTSQQILYSSAANTVGGLTLPSIPGGPLVYNGTNTAYFDPTKNCYLFEDFINGTTNGNGCGNLLWNSATNGTGAAVTNNTQITSGHPGQFQFLTGSTTTGYALIRLGPNNSTNWPVILGGGVLTCIWTVYLPVLSTATDIYIVRCGLMNTNVGQNPGNGVYFEYTDSGSSPAWSICTAASSTRTVTQTNVNVVAATWYTLRFDVNAAASSVSYQINGSPTNVGPISTNIPTGNIGPSVFILKNGGSTGTTSMELDVDMFYMFQNLTNPR